MAVLALGIPPSPIQKCFHVSIVFHFISPHNLLFIGGPSPKKDIFLTTIYGVINHQLHIYITNVICSCLDLHVQLSFIITKEQGESYRSTSKLCCQTDLEAIVKKLISCYIELIFYLWLVVCSFLSKLRLFHLCLDRVRLKHLIKT